MTTTEFVKNIKHIVEGKCARYIKDDNIKQFYHIELDETVANDYVTLYVNNVGWHTLNADTIDSFDYSAVYEIAKIYFHTIRMFYNLCVKKI